MDITYEIACQESDKVSVDKKVLELLSATQGFEQKPYASSREIQISAKQFLVIGSHLGLSEASVRMALSRQTKNGKLIRKDGLYSLARQSQKYSLPRFWLGIETRDQEWHGEWLLVNLGKRKNTATITRNLQKKAKLLGLSWVAGLGWVRPNNLSNIEDEVNFHFKQILKDDLFLVANVSNLAAFWTANFIENWPVTELNDFYKNARSALMEERTRLQNASLEQTIVRSFTFGRLLIERLSHDPWLPSQLIDKSAQQQLIDETKAYYKQIMPAWFELLGIE